VVRKRRGKCGKRKGEKKREKTWGISLKKVAAGPQRAGKGGTVNYKQGSCGAEQPSIEGGRVRRLKKGKGKKMNLVVGQENSRGSKGEGGGRNKSAPKTNQPLERGSYDPRTGSSPT